MSGICIAWEQACVTLLYTLAISITSARSFHNDTTQVQAGDIGFQRCLSHRSLLSLRIKTVWIHFWDRQGMLYNCVHISEELCTEQTFTFQVVSVWSRSAARILGCQCLGTVRCGRHRGCSSVACPWISTNLTGSIPHQWTRPSKQVQGLATGTLCRFMLLFRLRSGRLCIAVS